MAEQVWDNFSRLNAKDRFKAQSAEMGEAATEALVAETQVGPGMRVLDVACGSGEPSISIATLLRGTGRVVGIDLASAAPQVARERARQHGLDNVEFHQADVHELPFADESFDRVTSRFGVMFFGDLAKAMSEIRRVLKPGGRVALLALGAMTQPFFDTMVGTIVRARPELEVPASGRAVFKFATPGTLGGTLGAAGFSKVEERMCEVNWDWHGTPEEVWDYFRGIAIPFQPLLEKVANDTEVQQAVLGALRERFDGEWVRFGAHVVNVSGIRE